MCIYLSPLNGKMIHVPKHQPAMNCAIFLGPIWRAPEVPAPRSQGGDLKDDAPLDSS